MSASQVISKDLLSSDHQRKPGTHFRALLENQKHHSFRLKPVPMERHCKTCQCLTWEVFPPSVPHQQWPSPLSPSHSLHQSYRNSPTPLPSTAVTQSRRHRFCPPSHQDKTFPHKLTKYSLGITENKQTLAVTAGFLQLCLKCQPLLQEVSKACPEKQTLEHSKATQNPFPTQKKPLKSYLLQDGSDLQCISLIFKERICLLKYSISPGLGCHCECLNSPQQRRLHTTVTWSIIKRLLLLFAL